MPSHPLCRTASFFVLRSPSLPLDAIHAWGEAQGSQAAGRKGLRQSLRDLATQNAVREALALASPDLASRLDAWLGGRLEAKAARRVERALLKYLSRMSSRSTPFGLFAGVSLGTWEAASCLTVGSWSEGRKVARLDWGILESVVARLERDPQIQPRMRYRPNTSLHARSGWYRYLECREAPKVGRTYHLEAAEATPHLDRILHQSRTGARLMDLAVDLGRNLEVPPGEALTFLEQLVEAQILCGDLRPPLTSPDPLGHVAAALLADPVTAPRAEPLAALALDLERILAAPPGACPGGAARILPALADLGIPSGTRDILQVDLFRSAPSLALSSAVQEALLEGVETLRQLTPSAAGGPLSRFRDAFTARYGARWMPLLEVLDEESGIGFDGIPPSDSPLLAGLPFHGAAPVQGLSPRDRFLFAQIPKWQDARTWELDDAAMGALVSPSPQPFASSFAALASLAADSPAALDRGEFQFWMEQYSGPTAARWLGRFALGDPGLDRVLQNHLRREEASRPGAVFAEVVHVPEGRMGNVLARPRLREHEIPFLATSGVPPETTILPSDLRLTVRGDRVLLASKRLGREVIPRLSSAHNFAMGPVVYRFLAHLQDQDGPPGGWSWGALADQPFLPRVTRGRHVLSLARWRVDAREWEAALASSGQDPWRALQVLRCRLGLPRFLRLTEADNGLVLDLDEPLWAETLQALVSGRPSWTFTECFPGPEQALVASPEGRFFHELVVPFETSAQPRDQAIRLPPSFDTPEVRSYPPGSEWLFLKLYCGPASADRLLVELEPLLRVTKAQALWDRWHFIRYRDPSPHLRLRFHGHPFRLLGELLPLLRARLEGHLTRGLLWKWQVDTFEPELERYGGPTGFALAESWFHEDSQHVLDQLAAGVSLDDRWQAGLRGVDAVWAALGMGPGARRRMAEEARDGFRKEFGDEGGMVSRMGQTFRSLRRSLASGFPLDPPSSHIPGLRGLFRIREAAEAGVLQESLEDLGKTLGHMHLNRLLRDGHREQEWVLMEFLTRLYDSHLAQRSEPVAPEPGASR